MGHVIFAPCSRRKRVPVEPALCASRLAVGTTERLAEAWIARVRQSQTLMPANELYSGRPLVEARHAAASLDAELYIVSAGLGLIDNRRRVPAYSLTVAKGDPDSIAAKALGEFSPGLWWRSLHHALGQTDGTIFGLLSPRNGLAILALPGTYLDLIASELAALPSDLQARVRLVGPPQDSVPSALSVMWMPYDARFDGVGGPNPGTRGDFAQRAARHFAEAVVRAAPQADAATHAGMVARCLEPLVAPPAPRREAGTDAELIDAIRKLLPLSGGRSGKTLTLLRRQAGRACEQGRFRRLFAVATSEVPQ